eukprot:6142862-Prorocentrum_lima.AAC.1
MCIRDREWLCPQCQFDNHATRVQCRCCALPRPATQGPSRSRQASRPPVMRRPAGGAAAKAAVPTAGF